MIALSATMGASPGFVAACHIMRLLILTFLIPLALRRTDADHAARWFELLVPREVLTDTLQQLAKTRSVELEANSTTRTQLDLPDLHSGLQEYSRLATKYGHYWPQPQASGREVPQDPEIVLEKALATLQRWEKSAEPLIVELQKRAQEKSDLELIAEAADGDARRALNLLEIASDLSEDGRIGHETVKGIVAGRVRRFDKGGESFYDQISALHKSVRGSSPDAALYWLCRMLDGGCDPLYVARRVVRMASEDIGNADPRALQIALNAWDVQERLGSPEGELAIAQAIVYMAVAAKINAVYTGFKAAMRDARESGSLDVPLHLRNAPTKLMKELDYGKAYRYSHDEPDGYAAGETYFPEELGERAYYHPVDRGLEIRVAEKMAWFREQDRRARRSEESS